MLERFRATTGELQCVVSVGCWSAICIWRNVMLSNIRTISGDGLRQIFLS